MIQGLQGDWVWTPSKDKVLPGPFIYKLENSSSLGREGAVMAGTEGELLHQILDENLSLTIIHIGHGCNARIKFATLSTVSVC